MKKILVVTMFFIFCFAPLAVMAEQSAVDKGSFELGVGNIIDIWLYRSDNYENATWIGLGITPDLTVGYFIINGLMVGTTIGVTSHKAESWTEPNTSFFIQPVVKYYIPVSEKFFFNGKGFFGQYRENDAGDPDTYIHVCVLGAGLREPICFFRALVPPSERILFILPIGNTAVQRLIKQATLLSIYYSG